MKKVFFFTILALFGLVSAQAQDIVNLRMDRQQMGLRGYVASMDEDILLRKDYFREDWPQRKWFVRDLRNVLREDQGRVMTFNPAGRMTTITYTDRGKAGKKTTCTYASNGLLTSYQGEGYRVVAKYNGNFADINVYAETKDYASSVNLAKTDLNTAPYKTVFPFDLKCKQELTDGGLVLESRYYYVDSLPARVCLYSYNHLDLLTGEKITDYTRDENGDVTLVKYSYDHRGFLVKKTVNGKAVDETYTYVNNDLGDCVSMTVERPYGTQVYTFEYQYDDNDNWTVRLQYLDGVFESAALRTLTYHNVKVKAGEDAQAADKSKSKTDTDKQAQKEQAAAEKKTQKEQAAAEKQAQKEQATAEKQAQKEQAAAEKKAAKAQAAAEKEMLKSMSKEERKAYKEQQAADKQAQKERAAAEKQAKKERAAAEKQAKKERAAAENQAEKEQAAAEKQAKKDQAAAEKQAKKDQAAAAKAAKKASKKRD